MAIGVSNARRRRLITASDFTCLWCGLTGWEVRHVSHAGNVSYTFPTSIKGVWLSIDHVVPASKDGSHDDSNLQVLCTRCNVLKGTGPGLASLPAIEEHW